MDSNHRPSGYEPDELPLLHPARAVSGLWQASSNHEGLSLADVLMKIRGEWKASTKTFAKRVSERNLVTI